VESAFCDPELKLIETFGWDGHSFPRLHRHMARMSASASALNFPFDDNGFRAILPVPASPDPLRIRLTLDRAGLFALTSASLTEIPSPWRIAIAPDRLRADDPRLRHKTTDRALYDLARASLLTGIDEVLFLNSRDEVAEGTITTLFFDLGKGLSTPPLTCGCLPGCLRAELLETGQAQEAILDAADLPKARLWVGNSLRGLIPAVLA
jgi:4-amino-4-deoxychorismate lyase